MISISIVGATYFTSLIVTIEVRAVSNVFSLAFSMPFSWCRLFFFHPIFQVVLLQSPRSYHGISYFPWGSFLSHQLYILIEIKIWWDNTWFQRHIPWCTRHNFNISMCFIIFGSHVLLLINWFIMVMFHVLGTLEIW